MMNIHYLYFLSVLLMGHLIFDPLLKFYTWHEQPDKQRSRWLWPLIISLAIALTSYAVIALWTLWFLPLAIFVTHMSVYLFWRSMSNDSIGSLALEEGLHLLFALLVARLFSSGQVLAAVGALSLTGLVYKMLIILAGFLTVTLLGAVVIGAWVKPFQVQFDQANNVKHGYNRQSGFKDGGKMIGVLERALIYVFIMVGQPAAIGFLIAAKSILRFGEVKDSQDRMNVEYIIIGTMMSFLFAVVVGYCIRFFINSFPF